jgi:hypothetical protein
MKSAFSSTIVPMREFVRDDSKFEAHEEVNYVPEPVGPSSQSVCKCTVQGVCGSGSLVGKRNGKSLILSNAHVWGTNVGRQVQAQFPFLNNKTFTARIIMAAYSRNAIGMDWCIAEVDEEIPLPHIKLDNRLPNVNEEQYTAGYPRCVGPRFQRIKLHSYMNNGTIAQWLPNAIGGQSGSALHRCDNDFQSFLLTWSMGRGYGAGQSAYGIWLQYVNRSAVGYQKPEGLIELSELDGVPRLSEDMLQDGFFCETNITTLDIWAHMEPPKPEPPEEPDPGDPSPSCKGFAEKVLKQAESLNREADVLLELARSYGATPGNGNGSGGPTFGL